MSAVLLQHARLNRTCLSSCKAIDDPGKIEYTQQTTSRCLYNITAWASCRAQVDELMCIQVIRVCSKAKFGDDP